MLITNFENLFKSDVLSKVLLYRKTKDFKALKRNDFLFFISKIIDVRYSFPYAIEHNLFKKDLKDFYTIFSSRRNMIEDISYIKKLDDLLKNDGIIKNESLTIIEIYLTSIENRYISALLLGENCKNIIGYLNKNKNIQKENLELFYNEIVNSFESNKYLNIFN